MPPVGFEPTISTGERPQPYATDLAATGIRFLPVSSCRCSNRESREGSICAKTVEVWSVTLHCLTCIADIASAISPLVPLLLLWCLNTHNADKWRSREWRRFVIHSCPADKIVSRQTAEVTVTATSDVSHVPFVLILWRSVAVTDTLNEYYLRHRTFEIWFQGIAFRHKEFNNFLFGY